MPHPSPKSFDAPMKRRPGRPPVYVFTKPDAELSENERRLKKAVLKRRNRQNRSYHRKKRLKAVQSHHSPMNSQPSDIPLPMLKTPSIPIYTSQIPLVSQNQIQGRPPVHSSASLHASIVSSPILPPPVASATPASNFCNTSLLRAPSLLNNFSTSPRPLLSFTQNPSIPSCSTMTSDASSTFSQELPSNAFSPALSQHPRAIDPPSPSSFSPVIHQSSMKVHPSIDGRSDAVNTDGIVQCILHVSANPRNLYQPRTMCPANFFSCFVCPCFSGLHVRAGRVFHFLPWKLRFWIYTYSCSFIFWVTLRYAQEFRNLVPTQTFWNYLRQDATNRNRQPGRFFPSHLLPMSLGRSYISYPA